MARQSQKEIEEELKKQEDEVYGDETAGGSSGPSDVLDLDDDQDLDEDLLDEGEEEEEQE